MASAPIPHDAFHLRVLRCSDIDVVWEAEFKNVLFAKIVLALRGVSITVYDVLFVDDFDEKAIHVVHELCVGFVLLKQLLSMAWVESVVHFSSLHSFGGIGVAFVKSHCVVIRFSWSFSIGVMLIYTMRHLLPVGLRLLSYHHTHQRLFATVNGKKVWRSATRKTVSLYKKKNSKRVSVRKKPYLKKKKSTRKN